MGSTSHTDVFRYEAQKEVLGRASSLSKTPSRLLKGANFDCLVDQGHPAVEGFQLQAAKWFAKCEVTNDVYVQSQDCTN